MGQSVPCFASQSSRFLLHQLLIIVKKIDRALLHILPLVIVADYHANVFMAGHHLHLAVGEVEIERSRDGRAAKIMRREPHSFFLLPFPGFVLAGSILLFDLVESGELRPFVDDLADLPGRERLVEFERAVIDDRLKNECVAAVAVEIPPAPGVQLQIVVNRFFDVFRQGDRPFAAPLTFTRAVQRP